MQRALNRGSRYYEQLIIINMERARRLPSPEEQRKYVLVDSGSARLTMWENGRVVDSMKLVVGKADTATPMMAAYIRHVSVNPYWNVPPELVRGLIGPRVRCSAQDGRRDEAGQHTLCHVHAINLPAP